VWSTWLLVQTQLPSYSTWDDSVLDFYVVVIII
jgi:hypothetical protein